MDLFEIELLICIKMDLALNNQQRFPWHRTQTNKQTIKKKCVEGVFKILR